MNCQHSFIFFSTNFSEEPDYCGAADCSLQEAKNACFLTCMEEVAPEDPSWCRVADCSKPKALEECKTKCKDKSKIFQSNTQLYLSKVEIDKVFVCDKQKKNHLVRKLKLKPPPNVGAAKKVNRASSCPALPRLECKLYLIL